MISVEEVPISLMVSFRAPSRRPLVPRLIVPPPPEPPRESTEPPTAVPRLRRLLRLRVEVTSRAPWPSASSRFAWRSLTVTEFAVSDELVPPAPMSSIVNRFEPLMT